MTQATRRIGSVEITSVIDADFAAGPITEAFPDMPADALLSREADASAVRTADAQWRIRVRAWFVRHPGGSLLFDTGLGGPGSPTQSWAPAPGILLDELSELGVAPGDIGIVALSHAHDDHIGGLLDADGTPVFPNARHVVQRADIEWLRALAPDSDDDRAVWNLLAPLEDAGLLDPIEGDHRLADGIELRHLPGHTPGHQILRLASGTERLTVSADTWNHPAQLAHPEWPSGPDDDHAGAADARRALLGEILEHPGWVVAPTHLSAPFLTIGAAPDGTPTRTPA
jgi:glyoxylase-like metal-dependent hydrolase (beta-lactamase superfamily II)